MEEKPNMDCKNPNITVITNIPNNGHAAMVFTDNGMCVTAACNSSSLYSGILTLAADLILDTNESKLEEGFSAYLDEVNDDICRLKDALVHAVTQAITKKLLETVDPEDYAKLLQTLHDELDS